MELDWTELYCSTSDGKRLYPSRVKEPYIIFINVASNWKLAKKNYAELNYINEKYSNIFKILAFPCNQFGNHEPLNAEKVQSNMIRKYGIQFKLMDKISVNGDYPHPIYKYLKDNGPNYGLMFQRIRWNFEKFVVDTATGQVLKRLSFRQSPLLALLVLKQ